MDLFVAMTTFVRVVEKGSFAAASEGTRLSAPMVGNHVRFLEQRLGGLLINRTTRRQSLTELGRAYYERCRRVLAEVEAADSMAASAVVEPRGRLRVTAPYSIGATLLPAVIAEYLQACPAVEVDLVLSDRRVDLLEEGFDAALRVGELPDSSLIARSLAPLGLVLCASPAYLAAHGTPAEPFELQRHACLRFLVAGGKDTWHFEGPAGPIEVRVRGPLCANSGHALRAAALAGLGIIMQPHGLLADDLHCARLIRLLEAYTPPHRPMHLLVLPDRHDNPKVRRFADLVLARMGRASETGISGPRHAPRRRTAS